MCTAHQKANSIKAYLCQQGKDDGERQRRVGGMADRDSLMAGGGLANAQTHFCRPLHP